MKKKTNLFARAAVTLFFAVLGSIGAWAEDGVITVGSISYGNGYLPSYPQSAYSTTQQIYTKNEIGKAGQITSIAFYNYEIGKARNYDIYLSHTTKEVFDSNTDWVMVSEANKVFSGTVTLGDKWTVIDFDTPFQYDGAQNLLLTVDDNTGKSTGSNYTIGVYSPSGHQALYYYKSTNLDPTQPIEVAGEFHTSYSGDRKNSIRLCFETYAKPSRFEAVEVGDVSALLQCSLRGDATAWNLRYRKVAAEGEEEQGWVAESDLTERSFTIEDLDPATKYEAQVQAVFAAEEEGGEDHLSAWTDPLVFTTSCCPVEEQTDVMFALSSFGRNWYDYAAQIVDVTDEDNPVEVAFLRAPGTDTYGGTIKLCCGHKYQVNWVHDADATHAEYNQWYSFALYYNTGDKLFIMNMGEAPEETAELTTFVMDCTPYCAQMPQNLTVSNSNFNSATITFNSETTAGEIVYSTVSDFNPETTTPTSVTFTALPATVDPWGGTPPNASITLTGLEPLTEYYVRVRSVCLAEPIGVSRWSDQVKVTTGSRYDAPTQVIAEPVNSRTEKLSWGSQGSEKDYNLYYRKQAAGTAVDASAIQTFGGGNGKGFKENGGWGEGIRYSSGSRPFSNTVYVANVPAGSSFGFKAGNGKTGAGKTKFLYGMKKLESGKTAEEQMKQFDKKCLNDADRLAIINALKDKKTDLEAQLAALELKLTNGEITDDEYNQQKETLESQISAYNAEIAELESQPTDAQKLERMKELEKNIKDNKEALSTLVLKLVKGEITQDQYRSEKGAIEAQNALYGQELSELRAITTNAENPNKDGFSITKEKESANARTRGADDDTYIFFIRHSDPNGVLLVKDLTITPPEQVGEWTVIKNINKTEYTLAGLKPGTTYEVMVEPIYEDGTTGTQSPITVFTTLGEESEALEGVFSVSKDKKVQFAKGNLRYSKDSNWNDHWSLAEHQYDILGVDNLEKQELDDYGRRYPSENHLDLFCWSAGYSNKGTVHTYPDDSYYTGYFEEWGTQTAFTDIYGPGWSTMTKDEWTYLLSERENAATLKSFATVNGVKGLLLLPDEWNAPDGVIISEEMTAEQWATIEKTGAVFLPAAGTLTVNMEGQTVATVNDVNVVGSYWSSTPSKTDINAFAMTFTDPDVTPAVDTYRRIGSAVRLVKVAAAFIRGDANNDGKVDAADIVYVVAFIKNGTKLPGFDDKGADADDSGEVDGNDLIAIKNIVMNP